MRCETSVAAFSCEIFLVSAHHRDQYLVRKREKSGIELSEDDARALIQIRYQLEQTRVLVDSQSSCLGKGVKLGLNFLSPITRFAEHEVMLELCLVIARPEDRYFPLAQKSMPICMVPGPHFRVGKRHDL